MNEFSRTERLIGTEGLERLRHSSVAAFGVGGVGSHCITALARSGVGRFLLVDPDQVAFSNINRQSIAGHSTVGRHKTQVMREQIADINPQALVETQETFVLPENLEEVWGGLSWRPDYIVDAVDTVSAKLAIAEYAHTHRIPLISAMGTGNKLYPELFEIADLAQTSVCPLCRVMRRELKKRGIEHLRVVYSRESPRKPLPVSGEEETDPRTPSSISFVPPVAGLLMAGEVIRGLSGVS